jgi:hypothetical protein
MSFVHCQKCGAKTSGAAACALSFRRAIMPMSRSTLSLFWRGLIYLAFLSVCVEFAMQAFYWVTAGDFLFRRVGLPIFVREPYAGFGNRPGLTFDHRTNEFHAHYYINQAGFRVPRPDVEYTLTKPPNTYRVMLLGPSFAFGWGVDYELSFASVIQQLFEERGFAGEKRIEIINAGIPAMPVRPQLAWFERVGKGYVPDLVIQFVYGSMAIPNISEPQAAIDENGYLVSLNLDAGQRWRERFKNFATVFYGWVLWTKLSSPRSRTQQGERSSLVLGAGREMAASTDFDPTQPQVRKAMYVYNKLAAITSAAGVRLLVVYFPLSYAIHREDESRWRQLGVLDIPAQMAFDAAFVRYLNECQIPSIDITQQLQKSAQVGKRMYFWLDIHLTAGGNDVAARAVADHLTGRP